MTNDARGICLDDVRDAKIGEQRHAGVVKFPTHPLLGYLGALGGERNKREARSTGTEDRPFHPRLQDATLKTVFMPFDAIGPGRKAAKDCKGVIWVAAGKARDVKGGTGIASCYLCDGKTKVGIVLMRVIAHHGKGCLAAVTTRFLRFAHQPGTSFAHGIRIAAEEVTGKIGGEQRVEPAVDGNDSAATGSRSQQNLGARPLGRPAHYEHGRSACARSRCFYASASFLHMTH